MKGEKYPSLGLLSRAAVVLPSNFSIAFWINAVNTPNRIWVFHVVNQRKTSDTSQRRTEDYFRQPGVHFHIQPKLRLHLLRKRPPSDCGHSTGIQTHHRGGVGRHSASEQPNWLTNTPNFVETPCAGQYGCDRITTNPSSPLATAVR